MGFVPGLATAIVEAARRDSMAKVLERILKEISEKE